MVLGKTRKGNLLFCKPTNKLKKLPIKEQLTKIDMTAIDFLKKAPSAIIEDINKKGF